MIPDPDIDNVVIRGFTFTGQIQGQGFFGGIPVAISHPGKNIRFEDCAWVDLTASKRVIAVGTNYLMELQNLWLPDLATEVILDNCLFDDVSYEEEFLVSIYQAFHLRRTTFRNIRLPDLLPQGCEAHPDGCRNILHCRAGGLTNCSVHDVCVQNVDTTGAGPIVISQDTEWSNSGRNTWIGPTEFEYSFTSNNSTSPFCDLSVARLEDAEPSEKWPPYTCIDPPVFERQTGSCPL